MGNSLKTAEENAESKLVVASAKASFVRPARGTVTEARFVRGLSVTGPVELVVRTSSGHINVSAGRAGCVEIRGTICRRKHGDGEVESRRRVNFIVSHPPIEQNGNIVIIGYSTGGDHERDVSINYDVAVPSRTRLNAGTGSGSISIEGIAGPVDASAAAGAISAAEIGSDISLTVSAGEIEITQVQGNARLSTGLGPIHASGVNGNFHATAGNGAISASGLMGGKVEARNISGNIDLKIDGGGMVRVKTDSGKIRIECKKQQRAFQVESVTGDIAFKLPASIVPWLEPHTVYGEIASSRPITLHRREERDFQVTTHKRGRTGIKILTVWGNIQIE